MPSPDVLAWRQLPTAVEVVTPPTESGVVSLADLRRHVAQPLPDDDLQLQEFQEAAERVIAAKLARPLFTQTRRAWFDGTPGAVVRLSEPASSVVAVTTYAQDSTPVVVAGTVYQADLVSVPARLALVQGQQWPTGLRAQQSFAVTYVTGWARVDIPRNVRLAVALLVAHWYEHRTPTQAVSYTEVPYGIDALLGTPVMALGVA